jgi:hypothetical protein
MREVRVASPSFPEVVADRPLEVKPGVRWQVMCGDAGRWRVGVFSPPESSAAQCAELERHDCPEYFHLLRGRLILLLFEAGGVREQPLEAGRPVLVTSPHSAYCPDGPYTGAALVVERDAFTTQYRAAREWAGR